MKLLITGAWNCNSIEIDKLTDLGHTVTFLQYESEKIPCPYEEIEGIICNNLFSHHNIEKFTSLKYIQLTSAGLDRVPLDYIEKNNITIYNARGVYSIPMAEFALWGVLSIYKKSTFFHTNQQLHKWEKNRELIELSGKNVCVVGCGNVGNECAKRFNALGCNVFGVDIAPYENVFFEKIYSLDNIDNVLKKSDIIILTLPLNNETKHFFNAERFAKFNYGSLLVNISRGAVIDTKSLVDALNNKKLCGAVLDVFDEEPLPNEHVLWTMENVIITPHNSFVSENNILRLNNCIFNNLKKVGE